MRIFFFKKILFNCKQATLLALKKEQGKISAIERLKLFYHLRHCISCRRFTIQSQVINNIATEFRNSLSARPPFTLSEEIKKKIRQTIDNHK